MLCCQFPVPFHRGAARDFLIPEASARVNSSGCKALPGASCPPHLQGTALSSLPFFAVLKPKVSPSGGFCTRSAPWASEGALTTCSVPLSQLFPLRGLLGGLSQFHVKMVAGTQRRGCGSPSALLRDFRPNNSVWSGGGDTALYR